MSKTWNNGDGLYLKTGTDEAARSVAGEYEFDGEYHLVELVIQAMTGLTSSAVIQDDNFFFPTGARVDKVEVITETAATSGGSATLDIGLQRYDRSTELDYNGLLAAVAITSHDAAGETVTYTAGVSGAGALVGTTLANPGYLTANYNTAAYTAGKLVIRIFWRKPVNATS